MKSGFTCIRITWPDVSVYCFYLDWCRWCDFSDQYCCQSACEVIGVFILILMHCDTAFKRNSWLIDWPRWRAIKLTVKKECILALTKSVPCYSPEFRGRTFVNRLCPIGPEFFRGLYFCVFAMRPNFGGVLSWLGYAPRNFQGPFCVYLVCPLNFGCVVS